LLHEKLLELFIFVARVQEKSKKNHLPLILSRTRGVYEIQYSCMRAISQVKKSTFFKKNLQVCIKRVKLTLKQNSTEELPL
jgi:hypothetical protein